MGAWLMAGAGLAKGLGTFLGTKALKGGIKTAGTELYQSRQREAANALQMPEVVNPGLSEAYRIAGQDLSTVANRSADDLGALARAGAEGVTNAATGANAYLNPYVQGGGQAFQTLGELAAEPERQFNFQFSQNDPSYQFRLAEGQKALQKSAAARGGLLGGGTMKALSNYGQQAASQEYQNEFNRSLASFGANQASRQQRISTLAGMAGLGYGAAGQSGQNLVGAAQYGGNLGMQAGQVGGGWRNQAAQQQGQWGTESAAAQANVAMKYGDLARQLRLAGDEATAQSILANAQGTSEMWTGLGSTFGDLLSGFGQKKGGWGGGWGFGGGGNSQMPIGWEQGTPIRR